MAERRVKAIETHYAGCRFRSRLEARWAVFFDHMRILWEYEPQGYDLPSGKYLPDFRIFGENGPFIEIKGGMPDTREFEVASEINLYVAPLMIFCGDIPRDPKNGTAWVFEASDTTWVMSTPTTALIMMAYAVTGADSQLIKDYLSTRKIEEALTAARSARFEHGEKG